MHHFHVPDMTCGGCLRAVTRALQTVDSQAHIEGDLETRTLKVTSDRPETSLLEALSSGGYPAQPLLRQET
jgi:copper chaperone